jgi:hypothetical protein
MVSEKKLPREMTTSIPALERFLQKWRQALHDRDTQERRFWEGRKAYSDLQKTGYLKRLRIEEDSDLVEWHVMPKICRALSAYRRNLKSVRGLIVSQKALEDWLEQRARQFRKKSQNLADRECARDLIRISRKIDEVKRGTRISLLENWSDPLGFVLPFKTLRAPVQERELDSLFQVRLGVVLTTFLQADPFEKGRGGSGRPSLRTIARLIVLFLVCADLADVEVDEVKLRHNGHVVTVSGVYQQLVTAKIGKGQAEATGEESSTEFFGSATEIAAIVKEESPLAAKSRKRSRN